MKKLWLDTETLGLDSKKHRLYQIAAIFDPGFGYETLEFNERCAYQDGFSASAYALSMGGYFTADLALVNTPITLAFKFIEFLAKAKQLNGGYKLTLCGHNVGFDLNHLIGFFESLKIDGIDELFDYHKLDTVTVAQILKDTNYLEYKQRLNLTALCERFGVPLTNAHEALSDVRATRELYLKMTQIIRTKLGAKP